MIRNLRNRNLPSSNRLKEMFGEDEFEEKELDAEAEDTELEDDYDDDDSSDDIESEQDNEDEEDEIDLDSDDKLEEDELLEEDAPATNKTEKSIGDGSNNSVWDEEEDDLFILKFNKRKARLQKDWYQARVGKPIVERQEGKDGEPWVRVTIPFQVKKGNDTVAVFFRASSSLHPKSRLYPIIEGILGREPGERLDVRKLEGKRVKIKIDHSVDARGNVWEEVIAVERAS